MLGQPAINSQPYAKTHAANPAKKEDHAPKTQSHNSTKKKERELTSIQRELTTTYQEEGKIKDKKLLRGGKERNRSGHGQPDEASAEAEAQEGKEVKEPTKDTRNNARAEIKRFYENCNKEINVEPNPINVTFNAIYRPKAKETLDDIETGEDIFEYNDIRRATEDLRSANNDILIDDREPSEDYINVINVREPSEDITVTKDNVPYRQDKATNKQIYIDPKQGKKKSKKREGQINKLEHTFHELQIYQQ